MRILWLVLGLLFLVSIEILKVYFIMPFPGSQRSDSIEIAYFLHRNAWWLRIAGLLIVVGPAMHYIRNGKNWQKLLLIGLGIVYLFIIYTFNFRFLADKIFYQLRQKLVLSAQSDTTNRDKLIMGVVINKEARAYPIEIIGYPLHRPWRRPMGQLGAIFLSRQSIYPQFRSGNDIVFTFLSKCNLCGT